MPRRVKEERLARVIALQDAINARRIARSVGALEEVLIDSANPKQRGAMNGRTGGNRPVTVPGAHLEVGDLVQVRITAANDHWLTGELVEEAAAARQGAPLVAGVASFDAANARGLAGAARRTEHLVSVPVNIPPPRRLQVFWQRGVRGFFPRFLAESPRLQ